MVMKAAPDGSFFTMRESWFEIHNAFCKGVCITFFSFISYVGRTSECGILFLNSVNTRIQLVLNLLLNCVFILD